MYINIRILQKKYQNLPLPAKSSFWFAVSSVIQRGMGMLSTPIFTRLFTTDEYGVYSLYNAWEQLLLLLLALPLFQSLYNLYVKNIDKDKIASSVIGLNITLCVLWCALYVLFRDDVVAWLDLPITICDLLFIQLLFQPILTNWMVHQSFFYNYKRMTIISVSSSVLSVVLSLIFVLSIDSYKVEARIFATVLVLAVIVIMLLYDVYKRNASFYDRDIWKFAITFTIPLLPHFLSEYILSTSNRLLINYYCTKSEVAIFSVAYSLALILSLITSSINTSFVPYQTNKLAEKKYSTLSPIAIRVYLIVAIFLFLLMLAGPEIILLFGGYKYQEAVYILPPICLGVFFNYLFQIFARVEQFYEKKLYLVVATMVCSAISIAINYFLIPIFGYQIAAYTTLLCYISLCLFHYYFYRLVCNEVLDGIHIYDRKQLILLSVAMTMLTFLILYSYNYIVLRLLMVIGIILFMYYKRELIVSLLNLNKVK